MLVGDHFLLTDFGPYGILFMTCVVITVAIFHNDVENFGLYGILFTTAFTA